MRLRFRHAALTSMMCLAVLAGCGDDDTTSSTGTGTTTTGTTSTTGDGGGGGAGGNNVASGNYIRLHYRLQGDGDPTAWGAHFWGAGSTSPEWGHPQRFDQTDEFGVYTDIEITDTADSPDSWLGLIPVQCDDAGSCTKDVETAVRWVDLEKNAENDKIGEAWITQGQAVQTQKPESNGPAYKISRPNDFIDLGDGRVRLMFRVATGSTGVVQYGTAADMLTEEAAWGETDNINANGLVLSGLTTGQKIYYKIRTTLTVTEGEDLTDESDVLELTPIPFSTVSSSADWAAWGSSGIMYQLIVRTFADGGSPVNVNNPGTESGIDPGTKDGVGDLVGLRSMLPYLADMGVDAIWMTPVFAAASYHGYDTTNFKEIDPAVGTRKDFEDMAADAEGLGIKIIVDLVQNHVATVNPWFAAAVDKADPEYDKYHDWFVWSDEYSNMFTDPHPWDAQSVIWACKNYMCYHQIFGTSMAELNYHNPSVRSAMKDIAAFWIDLGADGFRLDASKHIDQFDEINQVTLSEHGTHVWWKEFNHYVKKEVVLAPGAQKVLLAGENRWDDPAVSGMMVPYAGDMDSQFDFPFRSVLSNFIAGGTDAAANFVTYFNTLRTATSNAAAGGNANHFYQRFLSNHDLTRPATQFKNAGGANLHALLKQAATIVMTVPGMPVIYYGEEFGKEGERYKWPTTDQNWDHDEHIREPMSWFENVTFTGDGTTEHDIDFEATNAANASLNLEAGVCQAPNPNYQFIQYMAETDPNSWAAQKDDPDSLYNHYKKLVQIRKGNAVFTAPAAQLNVVQNTATRFEYTVANGIQTRTVVLNRTANATTVTRTLPATDLLTNTTGLTFNVPAYGALILQ